MFMYSVAPSKKFSFLHTNCFNLRRQWQSIVRTIWHSLSGSSVSLAFDYFYVVFAHYHNTKHYAPHMPVYIAHLFLRPIFPYSSQATQRGR